MNIVLVILAGLIALEALAVVVFPRTVKRIIEMLSPAELRIAGVLELMVAGAALYFAFPG